MNPDRDVRTIAYTCILAGMLLLILRALEWY